MFNKAIIPALLVGGLGIAVAGCGLYRDVSNYNRNLLGSGEPKKETAEPKTEAVISRENNKLLMSAEELDQYCATRTERFITAHVKVRGQRLTCKEYVTLRAQGWLATETETETETETATATATETETETATETETETDRPAKAFTVDETIEKIIRLKNAGVGDEVIIQLLRSGRGNLPR